MVSVCSVKVFNLFSVCSPYVLSYISIAIRAHQMSGLVWVSWWMIKNIFFSWPLRVVAAYFFFTFDFQLGYNGILLPKLFWLFVDFYVYTCFYQFLHEVLIKLFCRSKQNNFMSTSGLNRTGHTYECLTQTGPDAQICRTCHAGPDRTGTKPILWSNLCICITTSWGGSISCHRL